MAVSLKHLFQSAKSDGADNTVVQPSDWNDEHVLSLAAGKVLGRDTSGDGAAQELPIAVNTSGDVGIGTTSPGSKLDVKGTLRLSGATSGYVGLAPAAAAGSTTYTLPSADGTSGQALTTDGSGVLSWVTPSGSGGATGGGSDKIFWQNDQTITTNYTISSGQNAGTFGPVSINSGVTVTVPSGSTWTVV